jgi:hemerythrin superfamily protein
VQHKKEAPLAWLRRWGRATAAALRGTDTEALAILRAQHRNFDELFARIDGQRDLRRKMRLFERLAAQLTMHATIEERHFYPAVRAAPTEALVKESLHEHRALHRLITDLLHSTGHEAFDEKLHQLKAHVQHHARHDEEGRLFPLVYALLSRDQREAIGQQMVATMVELQQRPRPRPPSGRKTRFDLDLSWPTPLAVASRAHRSGHRSPRRHRH